MRALRNLAFFMLGVLLVGVPMLVFAETQPATSATIWRMTYASNINGQSQEAVCRSYVASLKGEEFRRVQASGTYGTCYSYHFALAYEKNAPMDSYQDVVCPDSTWTLSGKTCTRPDPTCDQGSSILTIAGKQECVPDTCPDGSKRLIGGFCRGAACTGAMHSPQPPGPDYSLSEVCTYQGCLASYWKAPNHSVSRTIGGECDPSQPPPPDCKPGLVSQTVNGVTKCYPTAGTCASKGQCPAYVNNVTVCVACNPGTTTKFPGSSSTQTKTPDPSTGQVASTTTTNKNTTCVDGVCTTTTTITTTSGGSGAGGTGAGSTSQTNTQQNQQDQATFCEENPNSSMCSKDPTFKGPGAGSFTSKSTEIQDAERALSQKIDQIKAESSAIFGKLSTGAGGLPCDAGITVLGQQFRLCFSDFERSLSVVGSALLLIASLIALVIIFR